MKHIQAILSEMDSTQLLAVAERITHLRTNITKQSQEKFASSINVSQAYLSQIEAGKRDITAALINNLLVAYQVNEEWLYYGKGKILSTELPYEKYEVKCNLSQQEEAKKRLKTAFSLRESDIEFLSWYLSLTPKERKTFSNCLKQLKDIL